MPASYTLHELNQQASSDFVATLGWIFEASPWVASQSASLRPFVSQAALADAMCHVVNQSSYEAKIKLIKAHPDLGTRAKMADASVKEQHGAGLTSLSAEEYQELLRLNDAYKAKFEFPFILAVKGKTKRDIFESMRERLEHTPEQEFARALSEIYLIARFRLADALADEVN